MRAPAIHASDVLVFVRRVRDGGKELPTEPELRARLQAKLSDFREAVLADGIPERDADDMCYALAAAIDEALQLSSWSGRHTWSLHPLQVELFGDRNAGVGFFEKLRQIETRSPEAAEIFYLALALGFRGRYHGSETDEPQRILEHVAPLVVRPKTSALSPRALLEAKPAQTEPFPWKWLLFAAVGLAVVVYAIAMVSLSSAASDLTALIQRAA